MAEIPRFTINAIIREVDGADRQVGQIDFTAVLADGVAYPGRGRAAILQAEGLQVTDIQAALPDVWRSAAFRGDLRVPGLYPALAAFNEHIGGEAGWARLGAVLANMKTVERHRDEAAEQLMQVSKAAWEPNPQRFRYVYGPHLPNEGYAEPNDALDDTGFDEFSSADPYPKDWTELQDPARVAWQGRFHAWQRANLQPFAFGTTEVAWPSISAEEIRERQSEREEGDAACVVNVEDMVDNSLQDAYEGAEDNVVDLDGLCALVAAWAPHAGSGDEVDLGLDDAVTTWQNRQSITWSLPDFAVIVPLFPGVTHEECVAWCQKAVAKQEMTLATLSQSWVPPVAEMSPNEAVHAL